MSHIRDAVPQTQESKDCAYPLDLHGSFLMEQLPRELQCQFILKPSRLALCEQLNGELLPLQRRPSLRESSGSLSVIESSHVVGARDVGKKVQMYVSAI